MNKFPDCNDTFFTSTDSGARQNSTDNGTFNLYTGTQLSVNTFFAQLEHAAPACASPTGSPRRWASTSTDPDRERVPSFTLGVADVSPLEMAEAYATFAGRGLHCASRPVTAIEDSARQRAQALPVAVHTR